MYRTITLVLFPLNSHLIPIYDIDKVDNFNEIVNIYHRIVNSSLMQSLFPTSEKLADVKPVIKVSAESQDLNFYQSI